MPTADDDSSRPTCDWLVEVRTTDRLAVPSGGRLVPGLPEYRHVLDYTSEHGPGTAWDYHVRQQPLTAENPQLG